MYAIEQGLLLQPCYRTSKSSPEGFCLLIRVFYITTRHETYAWKSYEDRLPKQDSSLWDFFFDRGALVTLEITHFGREALADSAQGKATEAWIDPQHQSRRRCAIPTSAFRPCVCVCPWVRGRELHPLAVRCC